MRTDFEIPWRPPPLAGDWAARFGPIVYAARDACVAFYSDVDALPTEEYGRPDAERARNAALFVHALATRVVLGDTNHDAGAGIRHVEGLTGGRNSA